MMKHLFKQFIHDIRNVEDENLQDNEKSENSHEVKVHAVQLFDEVGKLFDKELKLTLTSQRGKKRSDQKEEAHPEEESIEDTEFGHERTNMSQKITRHLISEEASIGSIPRDV